jgi:hypothetical protein
VTGGCEAPVLVNGAGLDTAITEWFIGQFVGREVVGGQVDDEMDALKASYDAANDHLAYVMDEAEKAHDDDERAMWAPKLDAARAARTTARDERDDYAAKLRGFKLAGDLDADAIREMPVPELRTLLSQGVESLFIRRGAAWREPAAERIVGIFSPGQTPPHNLPGRGDRSRASTGVPFAHDVPSGARVLAA